MSHRFDTDGAVRAATLLDLLGRVCAERATGLLEVEHDGGLSRGFFRDGAPCGASVFDGFKPLGVFLLEQGIIDIEALDRSLGEVAKTRRPQGEILVEMGVLTREQLTDGLGRQQQGNVALLLSVGSGTYRFRDDTPPGWTNDLSLSPQACAVAALSGDRGAPHVTALLSALGDGRLVGSDGLTNGLKGFDLEAPELMLLDRLESPVARSDLEKGDVPAERARQLLAALVVFGLVTPEGGTPVNDPKTRQASPTGAKAPARSGDDAARARRSKLLKRAFQNIPGAQAMSKAPPPAAPPPEQKKAPEPAARTKTPAPGGGAEVRALISDIEARSALIEKEDFYKRLGLAREAPLPKVKAAHLLLVRRYHPDRVGAMNLPADVAEKLNTVFSAIQEAYETLSDPKARNEYDATLADVSARGDRDKARQRAEAEVSFKKGDALMRKKDYKQALVYLEPAMKADPKNGAYLVACAWARYNVGPREKVTAEVRNMLAQATQLEGAGDRAHYYLGLLARLADEPEKAIRHFENAVRLNKHFTEAVSELRVLRRRMEKTESTTTGKVLKKLMGRD